VIRLFRIGIMYPFPYFLHPSTANVEDRSNDLGMEPSFPMRRSTGFAGVRRGDPGGGKETGEGVL